MSQEEVVFVRITWVTVGMAVAAHGVQFFMGW